MQRLPETGIVWCLERLVLQTRRLSFLQSGFEAVTVALYIVLQEQRLWSRWFADGDNQEGQSTVDSPHYQTGFRQNLAYVPPVNQIFMGSGRSRADLGLLLSPAPDCRCSWGKLNKCRLSVTSNDLKYRQRLCRAFRCHTTEE